MLVSLQKIDQGGKFKEHDIYWVKLSLDNISYSLRILTEYFLCYVTVCSSLEITRMLYQ